MSTLTLSFGFMLKSVLVLAISVDQQYLTVIEHQKQQSQFVQSDYEEEIILMTAAHHQLQTLYKSNIFFDKCYFYGMNVLNQQIEAW